jgi:hypothetical protein
VGVCRADVVPLVRHSVQLHKIPTPHRRSQGWGGCGLLVICGPLRGLGVQPIACVSQGAAVALAWGSAELTQCLWLDSACSCASPPHHTAGARGRGAVFRNSAAYSVRGPLGGLTVQPKACVSLKAQPVACVSLSNAVDLVWGSAELT